MAYELTAKLRLIDKMTAPLTKALKTIKNTDDTVKRAREGVRRYTTATATAATTVVKFTRENMRMGSSLRGVRTGISGIRSGFLGLTAAVGGTYAAVKLFDATMGAAARREMDVITMESMFKDADKAGKFFEFLEKRAAESLFSEDDFFSAKAFIPVTKDLDMLQRMVAIQERLGASNMDQGMEGAAYAMREMFSSDIVSMVERFNLPRKVLNEIKDLSIEDQLRALDMLLDKMGFTQDMLDRQDATALAQYTQGIEKLRIGFMKMGTQGLERIKPLLEEFNRMLDGDGFQRFTAFGSDIIGGLMQGVVDGVNQARRYVETNFINNPAFNQLPDTKSKVLFVIDDLLATFNKWLSGSGGTQIEEAANLVSEVLAKGLSAATPKIAESAINVGKAIASGIWDGINQAAKDNPIMAALLAGGAAALAAPGPIPIKIAAGVATAATVGINAGVANVDQRREEEQKKLLEAFKNPSLSGPTAFEQVERANWFMEQYYRRTGGNKHATGLSRVPYDNYPATLHKDEMVLTKGKADEMRRGSAAGNVTITGNTFHVRQESDIDAIAKALARELNAGKAASAYA